MIIINPAPRRTFRYDLSIALWLVGMTASYQRFTGRGNREAVTIGWVWTIQHRVAYNYGLVDVSDSIWPLMHVI